MMSPEEFKDKWDPVKNGQLIIFTIKEPADLPFSQETKDFLAKAGLPELTPPYLEFISSEGLLLNLTTKFNMTSQYKDYWYLGANGSGDPICLKGSNNSIVFLNHDDDYKEVFINSSINQFAECILTYSNMIDGIININGRRAFLDDNIPKDVLERTKEKLRMIDSDSIKNNTLWDIEIDNLKN